MLALREMPDPAKSGCPLNLTVTPKHVPIGVRILQKNQYIPRPIRYTGGLDYGRANTDGHLPQWYLRTSARGRSPPVRNSHSFRGKTRGRGERRGGRLRSPGVSPGSCYDLFDSARPGAPPL